MRLGVLTTSYPRHEGDPAGCFVAGLARWLCAAGDRVEVLAPAPATRLATDPPGLAVRALRHGPRLLYGAGAPDNLAAPGLAGLAAWAEAPPFLARLVQAAWRAAHAWDAVIAHWLVPSALAASLGARALPALAIAHSSDVHLLARLGRLGGALLEALASPRARLVLTSEALRPSLARVAFGPRGRTLVERAVVQRMGIPADELAPAAAGAVAALRERHKLGERALILTLGRLIPVKGLGDLLEALARIETKPTLVVAGDGPERRPLEAHAARLGLDARFVGEVRGETKRAWLAAATLYVLPSRTLADGRGDSAPVALLEAMAAGLPVVATRVGGNAELIRDGVDGRLVPERDPGALAEALAELLARPELRCRLAEAGRSLARAHTWEVIGPRLRSLLDVAQKIRAMSR